MSLTTTQKCTLRSDMDTRQELDAAVASGDAAAIASYYNELSSGAELCWKTTVSMEEIVQSIDWTEYQSLARNVQATFELLTKNNDLASGLANVRTGLGDIFSGPQQANTRTALIAISQRVMTVGELVFADTALSPATLVYEGDISQSDVLWALDNC